MRKRKKNNKNFRGYYVIATIFSLFFQSVVLLLVEIVQQKFVILYNYKKQRDLSLSKFIISCIIFESKELNFHFY